MNQKKWEGIIRIINKREDFSFLEQNVYEIDFMFKKTNIEQQIRELGYLFEQNNTFVETKFNLVVNKDYRVKINFMINNEMGRIDGVILETLNLRKEDYDEIATILDFEGFQFRALNSIELTI